MDAIERWFGEHDLDGSFHLGVRYEPYEVIGPIGKNSRILYSTKPKCVARMSDVWAGNHEIAFVGRSGLPNETDIAWLRRLVVDNVYVFLGDLDPVDLLTFSWLRQKLPEYVVYLGINDAFMSKCGFRPSKVLSLDQTESEVSAMSLMSKLVPDLSTIVGPDCERLLKRGRKLELEAFLGHNATTYSRFADIVKGA